MDQYKMNANFRPAAEPKNGHIGFADVTIADAIRIYDISVFEKEGGGYNIDFPYYTKGDERRHFVIPHSPEANAQFVDVIGKAVNDPEHHFGWTIGKQDPYLTVSGKAVQEKFCDARFNVDVGDLCTLKGIRTSEVKYTKKSGEPGIFIPVDFPARAPYEKDGDSVYPPVFEALQKGKVYNKETKQEEHKDFQALLKNLVRGERAKVLGIEKKTSLNDKINDASQKTASAPAKDAPAMEAQR